MIETTVAACDPVKGGATTATTTTVATGAGATATDVKSMPAEAEPDINAAIISNNDVSDDATERYSAHIKSAQRQRTSRGAGELLTWVQCVSLPIVLSPLSHVLHFPFATYLLFFLSSCFIVISNSSSQNNNNPLN